MKNKENKSAQKKCLHMGDIPMRDFYASQAMLAVMGETQEMRVATFWDWVKDLLVHYAGASFLYVNYEQVEGCYEKGAKRAFEYADAMILERDVKN